MRLTTRRRFLRTATVAGLGSPALAGCLSPYRPSSEVAEGFEDGLDDWTAAGHVGPDAGGPFDWSVDVTDERARSGTRSLAVFTEGRYDDGTAWVTRPVSVDPGATYRARGSAYYYSESESFNVVRHAVLYLGPDEPTAEDDFLPPGENSSTGTTPVGGLREPLDRAAGWNEYRFEYEVDSGSDRLHFAVGTSVVWETDRTDFVDDVSLTLERV